MAENTSASKWW